MFQLFTYTEHLTAQLIESAHSTISSTLTFYQHQLLQSDYIEQIWLFAWSPAQFLSSFFWLSQFSHFSLIFSCVISFLFKINLDLPLQIAISSFYSSHAMFSSKSLIFCLKISLQPVRWHKPTFFQIKWLLDGPHQLQPIISEVYQEQI